MNDKDREKYTHTADLSTLIKQERQKQPPHQQITNNKLQINAPFSSASDKEYQTLLTQYTSNYDSNKKPNRTVRSYRQEISFVRYQQHPQEFLAYVIVTKESNFGIFNNERLLVLDSKEKQIKYYSDIPSLPIHHVQFTQDKPKEVISIDRVTKLSFLAVKGGVGEVIVSWNEGGSRKQWHLTMGSQRVASEFAFIISQVRVNEHLKQKAVYKIRSAKVQNKVNKQTTPFISQIKKKEQQQVKNQSKRKLTISSIYNTTINSPKNQQPKPNQQTSEDSSRFQPITTTNNQDKPFFSSPKNNLFNLNSPNNNPVQQNKPTIQHIKITSPRNSLLIESPKNSVKGVNSPKNSIHGVNSPKNSIHGVSSPKSNSSGLKSPKGYNGMNDDPTEVIGQVNSPKSDKHTPHDLKSHSRDQSNPLNSPKNVLVNPDSTFNENKIIDDSSIYYLDSNIIQHQTNQEQTVAKTIINQNENPQANNTAEKDHSSKAQNLKKPSNIWLQKEKHSFRDRRENAKIQQKITPNRAIRAEKEEKLIPTKEVKIQEIIKIVHQKHEKREDTSKNGKGKLQYLSQVLQNRKDLKNSGSIQSKKQPLSQSKVLVKKYQTMNEPKPSADKQKPKEEGESKGESVRKSGKKGYTQKNEAFRQSLLSERMKSGHKVINLNKKNLPKRQTSNTFQKERYSNSSKRNSNSTSKEKSSQQHHSWFIKWMNSSSQQQFAEVYNHFYLECVDKVKRVTSKYNEWHLTHKIGNQFILEENNIQYKYYVLANTNQQEIHHLETVQTQTFLNFNYLFQFIKKIFTNNIKVIVPLTCIIDYKGLKVFCKALVNSQVDCHLVEDLQDYLPIMRQLQKESRLMLFKCELYQIFQNDRIHLYVHQLDALPRIGEKKQLLVDPTYIKQYIVSGIIASQYDLDEINHHLQNIIYKKILQHLNRTHLVSGLELTSILQTYGLNQTFLPVLYQHSIHLQYTKAQSLILSSVISSLLQRTLRETLHLRLLKRQMGDSLQQSFLSIVNRWLGKEKEMYMQIERKVKQVIRDQIEMIDSDSLDNTFILSSLMINLGLNCDFKYKIKTTGLQNLSLDLWSTYQLHPQEIQLYFMPRRTIYHYHHFNPSKILYNNIFNLNFLQNHHQLKQAAILAELNHDPTNPYYLSYLFQLMPTHYHIALNYYLSHILSPHQHQHQHSDFQRQFQQPYFNLEQHSTSLILTHQHFAQDLIGIKWLIKNRSFEQADVKISEMRQRVYIWAKQCPKILMEMNDLQALYALKMGRYSVATQKSLLSLQVAIHFYGHQKEQKWQIIWQKSFLAGNIHFQLNKLVQAFDFYSICTDLIENLNDKQLKGFQVSEEFLQIYNKKGIIQFGLGNMQQASLLLNNNLLKLNEWKRFFSKEGLKVNLIKKILKEEYHTYCLLFRVLQLRKQKQRYYQTLIIFLEKYMQKEIKSKTMIKIAVDSKERLKDIVRYVWMYVVMSLQQLNLRLSMRSKSALNIYAIEKHIKNLYIHNKEEYIYTMQEMYKFIHELLVAKKEARETSKGVQGLGDDLSRSLIISVVVECLQQLSNSLLLSKRCKLYDQQSRQNALFVLQSLLHMMGYDYALGVIQSSYHQYVFQF